MDKDKPYRPNVGIALFNAHGRVLIARRFQDDGPEIIMPGLEWQMPQGGIDPDEDPRPAAMRELYEETGVTSVEYLGETPDWMTYEFPPYDGPPHRLAKFRGQRQKWFAFRFRGQRAARSWSRTCATISRSSSTRGAGSRSPMWRTWWCRSGARFIRRWRESLRGLPRSPLGAKRHAGYSCEWMDRSRISLRFIRATNSIRATRRSLHCPALAGHLCAGRRAQADLRRG